MATELGKAYVQIVPSAKGIQDSITKELGGETEKAGKTSGTLFSGTFKKVFVAAGVGGVIKKSLTEGADIQQSLGGIETLYKDSSDKMKQYANEAFATTGLSANDYMENVTSFSAGLISSMGGDTDKAADVANRAMIDMSDNANKMGTDMGSIQNAYQGFARQQYGMLDNLKLGYGGTKSEMERLLADATELSGVEYNIDNLSDVYNAIGVIQDNLGITGTTALEAEETFTGSFAAMKAAAENVLAGLTTGYNLGPSLQSLAQTVATFLFDNLLPMVGNFLAQLPGALITFFSTAVPLFLQKGAELITNLIQGIQTNLPILLEKGKELLTTIITGMTEKGPSVIANIESTLKSLLSKIVENLPLFLEKGRELLMKVLSGIQERIPSIISKMAEIMKSLIQKLIDNLPAFLQKGAELLSRLASGFAQAFPSLMAKVGSILRTIITSIAKEAPSYLAKGFELLLKLAAGIVKAMPDVLRAIGQILKGIIRGIAGYVGQMVGAGRDLLLGLARGIAGAVSNVVGQAVEAAKKVVNSVKSFFGIRSPSRVFMEIGEYLDEGLAKGIDKQQGTVVKSMANLSDVVSGTMNPSLDVLPSVTGGVLGSKLNETNGMTQVTFALGAHKFKALVDDITKVQDRTIELELAY